MNPASPPQLRSNQEPESFPLVRMQNAMWQQHQFAPQSPAHHIAFRLTIQSSISLPNLQAICQTLLEQHPQLRARFAEKGDIASQTIVPSETVAIAQVDGRGWTQTQLDKAIDEAIKRPFYLKNTPPYRIILISTAPNCHELLFIFHHIVIDGWSAWTLLEQFRTLAIAQSRGKSLSLPANRGTFQQFTDEQQAYLATESAQEAQIFWQKQLSGNLPTLQLPNQKQRAGQGKRTFSASHATHRHTFIIPTTLRQKLADLAHQQNTTLFTLLHTAYAVLLHRHSQQADLLISTPVIGRQQAKYIHTVGSFINMLPLRVQLQPWQPFTTLLQIQDKRVVAALNHQRYPADQILAKQGNTVQTALLYQQPPRRLRPLVKKLRDPLANEPLQFGNLTISDLDFDQAQGMLDLVVELIEINGGLHGAVRYRTDLFEAETVACLMTQYATLLASIVEQPALPISRLSLLPLAERRHLLTTLTQTAHSAPEAAKQTIPALFAAQAAQAPTNLALKLGDETMTFAELEQHSNRLAHHLRLRGVQIGDVVGVMLPRSPQAIIALLAIMKAGGTALPLDPAYPEKRLNMMMADAQPKLLITTHQSSTYPTTQLTLSNIVPLLANAPTSPPNITIPSELPAALIYTSGSTGMPKGVPNSHQALLNRFHWMWREFPFEPGEVCAQKTALTFVDSLWEIFGPLLQGVPLVILPNALLQETAAFLTVLHDEKISRLVLVPSLLRLLLDAPQALGKRLPTLTRWTVSGEALPTELARRFHEQHPTATLLNLYGSSEVAADVTYELVQPQAHDEPLPIGQPLANCLAYLLDAHLNPVPMGLPGNLYIGGTQLSQGYHHQPALTAEQFIPNPFISELQNEWAETLPTRLYKTGDRAKWLTNGRLQFLGRADHQIKVRGVRIELGEIEAALHQIETLKETAVFFSEESQQLTAYLIPQQPDNLLNADQIRHQLAKTLPTQMLPDAFRQLLTLPLTPNGKVDRLALTNVESQLLKSQQAAVAPRNPIETALADMWQRLLGSPAPSVHADFFAHGGHSLLATQLLTRVRHTFGVSLDFFTLFDKPTIAGLATAIQQAKTVSLPPVPQADRNQPLPLAFSQERMWFLQLLQPESTAYSVPSAVRLRGQLDVPLLEECLTHLVAKHEILRTQIWQQKGQPLQHILPATSQSLPLVDLRHLPEDERETAALQQLVEDTKRPFNLQAGSLLRIILFQIGDAEHLFYINMHHIIADAWSSALMLRELAALYHHADRRDTPLGHPQITVPTNHHDPSIQYADYALWQRQWFSDHHLDKQLTYWRQKLAGVPTLDLPTDHPRPALQTYRGGKLWQSPQETTFEALQQLGQQEGATLFMTLLTAFKTLLHRFSGQSDIAVGIPIANRHHLAAEQLLGTLVNTVVHRSEHVAGLTFRQLLRQVRRTALEAYAHQDMPFAKLVEELQLERNPSHSPLFQVMFNYINVPLNADMADELKWSMVPFDMETAQFDLTLTVVYTPEVQQVVLEYNRDLFEPETAAQMLAMYQHLLEGIVAEPDGKLATLPLLPPTMQAKIHAFNQTTAVFPTNETIHAHFEAQAAKTPNQPALRFGNQTITFETLNKQANQLAHWLRQQGADTGDIVSICLPRSPEAVVSMLATLKVGAAYLPLDPSYPTERLNLMRQDTQARFLLTLEEEIGRFPDHNQLISFRFGTDDAQLTDQPTNNLNLPVALSSPAYLIYTSGSTGAPKGVVGPHRAMLNRFHWMWQEFPFEADEVCVQKTALNFVDSIWELFGPLLKGIPVVIVPDAMLKETAVFIDLLARERVSRIVMVPSLLRLLLDLYPTLGQTLPALQLWTLSGEALPYDLVERFQQQHPAATLLNLYGSSEVAADVTFERIGGEPAGKNVPIGRPIANATIHLLDKNLQPVPLGVSGEIYVGGVIVADGYWKRPALTAARFIPDPFNDKPGARLYRMGDLGKWLKDGRLLFVGRGDQQVKIRGFRIELGEVEKALLTLPAVREGIVLAKPNALGGQSLIAYVVRHNASSSADNLRAALRQTLPDYMLPSQFIFLNALPLLPNKKINRRALPDPEAEPISRSQALTPAATLRQKQLLFIWQQLLGVEQVGIDDDFFALGGHSLLVVRLLNEIEKKTDIYLPLATFFKATTIRQLAEAIEYQAGEESWSSLVEIQAGDPNKMPFFCVHGITGDVFWFGQLAQHMDKSQPFYGLQSRGLDGVQAPLTNVETMAAHYIREMKRVQPHGPYCLGGYSFGANVAYEMARQLEQAGETVDLLAVIDQPPTKSDYYEVRWNGRLLWHILKAMPYRLRGLQSLNREERRRRLARAWRLTRHGWARRSTGKLARNERPFARFATELLDHAEELPPHVQRLIGINYTAAMAYEPQPIDGPLTLLRAAGGKLLTSHDPEMGWGQLTSHVEVEVIPASHLHLFREPHVQVLAICLQKQLG